MLTKKLKFDDEVLSVIRNMDWSENGMKGILNDQLGRDLYIRVNKALVNMGGRWSKKEKGHIFPTDPRNQVENLLSDGSLTVERDGFFETPKMIIMKMMELVEPFGNILEPSAGLGAIVGELVGKPMVDKIIAIEKNIKRAEKIKENWGEEVTVFCMDFLEYFTTEYFDRVYMNPPFEEGQDIDHILNAYKLLVDGGKLVSIMSEGPFFRSDKKASVFREWLEKVDGYSEKLPQDSFKESGTGVNTRIIIIEKRRHYGKRRKLPSFQERIE